MAELTLINQGKAFIHREAIKKIKLIDVNLKNKRSAIIKKLLPNYVIQPKPMKFHDSTKPDKFLIGGYGSGKTYTGSAEDIFLAYVNRPAPGLVVIQSQSNSEVTTEDDLKKVCEDNNLEYWLEDDRGGTYRYFYIKFGEGKENLGKLMLASGSKADLLKGPTVAFAHIDEPFVQPKETMEVVISRARDDKAVINQVHYTGTIEPDLEWGHKYVDNSYKGDANTFKIVISMEENKFAPAAAIKRMRRTYSEDKQKMYIDGINVNISGKNVYDTFTDKNIKPIKSFKFKEGIRYIGLGMDFNVGKMCAAEFNLDDKVRRQMDEYMIENSNTKALCYKIIERMKDKYPGIGGKNRFQYSILIVPDASSKARKSSADQGKTDATIIYKAFKAAGFNFTLYVPPVNPPVYDRVQGVNEMISEERYIVYDNCEETILDRKHTKWKKGEGWNIDKGNGRSHMSEAGDYYLYITRAMIEANENSADDKPEFEPYEKRCY